MRNRDVEEESSITPSVSSAFIAASDAKVNMTAPLNRWKVNLKRSINCIYVTYIQNINGDELSSLIIITMIIFIIIIIIIIIIIFIVFIIFFIIIIIII